MIRSALDALAEARVPYALRGEQRVDAPPPGGDVDLLVGAADLERAEQALLAAGFRRLQAPTSRGHRFYLGFDQGRWLKLDVNVVPRRLGWDLSARDPASRARFAGYRVGPTAVGGGPLRRLRAALDNRRPASLRRLGPVVAVLGPDGAGKGSVIAALRAEIPVAVSALYLGDGGNSRAEYTTRPPRPQPPGRGARAVLRSALRLLPQPLHQLQSVFRRTGLAWLRLVPAYARAWRGDIVLSDRHPVEVLAMGAYRPGRATALERQLIEHALPWPDALIVLDASGAELFRRKGEHSAETLERRRQAYLEAFEGRAAVVPTGGGLEQTVARASAVTWAALSARRGW